MADRARAYQAQFTGAAAKPFVGDLRFDSLSNGVLLEAKGPGCGLGAAPAAIDVILQGLT